MFLKSERMLAVHALTSVLLSVVFGIYLPLLSRLFLEPTFYSCYTFTLAKNMRKRAFLIFLNVFGKTVKTDIGM